MNDARTARRVRIGNGLNAVWFVILSCALAVIVGDIVGGVLMMALSALGYAIGVLCTDHFGELPSGKLLAGEKRVLHVVPPVAFALGFSAAILAKANADSTAVVVAAVAVMLAVAVGAFSVWLAVR